MRFQSLDLNLLVALDALLKERSVSAAAESLNLSQSALSGALRRLREYFHDELLLNTGRGMKLTARAESLVKPVRDTLVRIDATITRTPEFDPASSARHISLIVSDVMLEVLINPALRSFAKIAPQMTFSLRSVDERSSEGLERGDADLLVTNDVAADMAHPGRVLFMEDLVAVAWRDNQRVGAVLTKESYFGLPHVSVQLGSTPVAFVERWLRQTQQAQRRIEVFAPTFASVSALVVGTDRLALMYRRHAHLHSQILPIKLLEIPFAMPLGCYVIQWHSARSGDPALAWVVERLIELSAAQAAEFGTAAELTAEIGKPGTFLAKGL